MLQLIGAAIFIFIAAIMGYLSIKSHDLSNMVGAWVFLAFGVLLLVFGLKKIVKDILTSKDGEECIGLINNVYETGGAVNNDKEYAAEVICYIPSSDSVIKINEVIGFNKDKYLPGTYFKCKYFENDINFGKEIDKFVVPSNIREKMDEFLYETTKKNKE